jgi:predicted transcriptional regulator
MENNVTVIASAVAAVISAIAAVIALFKKKKRAKNYSNSENQNTAKVNQIINAPNAIPVAFGVISGNPTITINNNNNENEIRLTSMALTILKEISKSEFRELRMYQNLCNFWDINVNGHIFGDSNIDENIIAKSAVDELIRYNFINKTSKHNYQITHDGIDYLKNIS